MELKRALYSSSVWLTLLEQKIKTLQSKAGSLDVNVYRSATHMTGTTLAPADSRVFTYEAAI